MGSCSNYLFPCQGMCYANVDLVRQGRWVVSCAATLCVCVTHHSTICHLTLCLGLHIPFPTARARGHTRKQNLLPERTFSLFAQGSFSFLVNVLVLPARLAGGSLTPCQWSESRCYPSCCQLAHLPVHLPWPVLVSACQAVKLKRALSVTETEQLPALCWRLALSTKCA